MSDPSTRPAVSLPEPVTRIAGDEQRKLEHGIAICLSGGGFRATLYHAGALWRLSEAGILGSPHLKRISSVSGGSITAGILGLHWNHLDFDADRVERNLENKIIRSVLRITATDIDVGAVVMGGALPGFTIGGRVAAAYDKHAFGGASLQDLPDDASGEGPTFVINSVNTATGNLWRFTRRYMADWKVGRWFDPNVRLALAVACSSAFPPFLSPVRLRPDGEPAERYELADEDDGAFLENAWLTDGGAYDNLGLETAYKRYTGLLVSDAGRAMDMVAEPHTDWGRHTRRILDIIHRQTQAPRKRLLIENFIADKRFGAYWGLASKVRSYNVGDPFGYESANPAWWQDREQLTTFETRLRAVTPGWQKALINWGYAICDAALTRHAGPDLKAQFDLNVLPAHGLPYPNPER